jgi:hypothetical protein
MVRSAARWSKNAAGPAVSIVGNLRLVPETLAIIVLLIVFDKLIMKSSSFDTVSPHPFWIPVVLMAVQYGVAGGIFATVAATAVLYAVAPPLQTASQDFYTYAGSLLAQPAGWLAATLVVGGLRNLHMAHAAELQASLDEARASAETLNAGLERAVAEIDRLESRIAGETVSRDGVMQALADLDARDTQTLVASFADVVREGVGASSLTLYLHSPDGATPIVRIADGDVGGLSAAPTLPASLLEALGAERGVVVLPEPAAIKLLPAGAICAVPIISDPGVALLGVILIERLQPGQDIRRVAMRADLLGRALGKMLRAMFSRFRGYQSERPQQVGG